MSGGTRKALGSHWQGAKPSAGEGRSSSPAWDEEEGVTPWLCTGVLANYQAASFGCVWGTESP